jgi:hypothetical protein
MNFVMHLLINILNLYTNNKFNDLCSKIIIGFIHKSIYSSFFASSKTPDELTNIWTLVTKGIHNNYLDIMNIPINTYTELLKKALFVIINQVLHEGIIKKRCPTVNIIFELYDNSYIYASSITEDMKNMNWYIVKIKMENNHIIFYKIDKTYNFSEISNLLK